MIQIIGMTQITIIHFEPFQKLLFWFKENIYFFIRFKKNWHAQKLIRAKKTYIAVVQKLVHAKKNFLRWAKISTNKVSGCPKAIVSVVISLFGEKHWKSKKSLSKHYFKQFLTVVWIQTTVKNCKSQQMQIFAITKIIFNSHILSAEGISPGPEKIKSFNQLQVPTNII